MAIPSFTVLKVSVNEGVCVITFDQPQRKNAFNEPQYRELTKALQYATKNDDIRVVVITGSGDYYSSGNDLSGMLKGDMSQDNAVGKALEAGAVMLEEFTLAFIDCPKILIAAVNGPALGIAATTLGLCDIVYGSSTAYLQCPFVALGQTPEGGSSMTFPRLFGKSRAAEILYLGRKADAAECERAGLFAAVFPSDELMTAVMTTANALANQPPISLMAAKEIVRRHDAEMMRKVALAEIDVLRDRWSGSEFMEAIMKFMAKQAARRRKSKL